MNAPIRLRSALHEKYRTLVTAMHGLGFRCGHTLAAIDEAVDAMEAAEILTLLQRGHRDGVFKTTSGRTCGTALTISQEPADSVVALDAATECKWIVNPEMLVVNPKLQGIFEFHEFAI